ncbi:FMN-binding negative transcriptional regulator [Euryhalocaulis caribicus]|uniref:FMN-binding negative transcriptional regulator n=1 Tax=Euryhalocaulis caribicus TaxID=1161401 RepID=UPI0003B3B6D9|nr:FMN-binding negative transcriptional regulator [Euryhalocaulis caribicus]
MTAHPYPPPKHVSEDRDAMIDVVRRFPFATLASAGDPPAVAHLPVIWAPDGEGRTLWTHLDRANPQTPLLDDKPVTVMVRGPDAYMSPELFEGDYFPTWNYVIVECAGTARLLQDDAQQRAILDAMAAAFEGLYGKTFSLAGKEKAVARLLPLITGVEITVERMTGRFKLLQDRPESERETALAAFERRPGLDAAFREQLRKLSGL